MIDAIEIDPARTVTHPNGITQVFATRTEDRVAGEAAIGSFRRVAEWNAYGTYARGGSTLGTYATAPRAYAAIVLAHEGTFEVTWPDGTVYRNRDGRVRLTEDEAKATAPAIGGTWRRATGQEG